MHEAAPSASETNLEQENPPSWLIKSHLIVGLLSAEFAGQYLLLYGNDALLRLHDYHNLFFTPFGSRESLKPPLSQRDSETALLQVAIGFVAYFLGNRLGQSKLRRFVANQVPTDWFVVATSCARAVILMLATTVGSKWLIVLLRFADGFFAVGDGILASNIQSLEPNMRKVCEVIRHVCKFVAPAILAFFLLTGRLPYLQQDRSERVWIFVITSAIGTYRVPRVASRFR